MLRQVVSSKFLDSSKFHSQRLLDAEPSLQSIVYDRTKLNPKRPRRSSQDEAGSQSSYGDEELNSHLEKNVNKDT